MWSAAFGSDYAYTITTADMQLRDQTTINILRQKFTTAL